MPKDDISLKSYIEGEIIHVKELIKANRELSEQKFIYSQIAIDKAEQAQALRNEAQNEWRQQFKDQTATFTTVDVSASTRNEMMNLISRNTEDVKALSLARANLEGRLWAVGVGFTIVNIAIGIALSLLR